MFNRLLVAGLHVLLISLAAVFFPAPAMGQDAEGMPESPALATGTEASSVPDDSAIPGAENDASDGEVETDHAGRLIANFVTLLDNRWQNMGWFLAKCLFNAVLWGALMMVVGLATGMVAWLLLRRHGLLDAPWKWYRYAIWIWLPLMLLSIAIGLTGAGVFLGLERQLKHAIVQERVLDQIAGDLILAITMDSTDYQLTGNETSEQLQAVLADSETIAAMTVKDIQAAIDEMQEDELNPVLYYVIDLFGREQAQQMIVDTMKVDPRLLILIFHSSNLDQYLQDNPQAQPAVMALALHFTVLRRAGCDLVEMVTRPLIWAWAGIGLGLPLALLGLLRLSVYLTPSASPCAPP